MQTCNTLNIVTNSNGIVRVYADGGMVFEIQANYVKTESFVDCDKPAVSGTVPKAKKAEPIKEIPSNVVEGMAFDHSELPTANAEEKWRLANFESQPESRYFNSK